MLATPSNAGAYQLTPDEVHSWCFSLDVSSEACARLDATLAPDERSRSARFRFERDQRRFVAAHGILRELLARYLETQPSRIRYVYNAFGKPDLSPEFGTRLRFNLSHSAGCALIAIAAEADIGVDLEHVRPEPDRAEIARQFFSAVEIEQLNRLPSHLRARAFLSCWTKKEAYVKARGEGLGIPLTSFSVPLTSGPAYLPAAPPDAPAEITPARWWWLYTLEPGPGYIGALAIPGGGWRLSQRQWQPRSRKLEPALLG